MGTGAAAAGRLRAAARDGRLSGWAGRHALDLVVLFGSVLSAPQRARDLDVAVRVLRGSELEVVEAYNSLSDLADTGLLDLMVLNRASVVAREQALVYGELLYEREPGLRAEAQIAASTARMDTQWLRDLDLNLMAQ